MVSAEITDCPRLFTLQKDHPALGRRARFHQDHFRLTLWRASRLLAPVGTCELRAGPAKEWFTQVSPYVSLVFRTLQLIVPLAGSIAVAGLPAGQLEQAQAHLEVMNTLVTDLPRDIAPERGDGDLTETAGQLTAAEGQALRALRAILFAHDQSHAFGGMHRVQAPNGDILWVCPNHYPEYDPGLPHVPSY